MAHAHYHFSAWHSCLHHLPTDSTLTTLIPICACYLCSKSSHSRLALTDLVSTDLTLTGLLLITSLLILDPLILCSTLALTGLTFRTHTHWSCTQHLCSQILWSTLALTDLTLNTHACWSHTCWPCIWYSQSLVSHSTTTINLTFTDPVLNNHLYWLCTH